MEEKENITINYCQVIEGSQMYYQSYVDILNNRIKFLEQQNKELQTQYCERTDCTGRIGVCENHKIVVLEDKIKKLQDRIDKLEQKYKIGSDD